MAENLFKTGSASKTGGKMGIYTKGVPDIVKRLAKLEAGGARVIERTVKDFGSRAPAWVSKGVREHYGVDAGAIKDAAQRPRRGRTSIRLAGTTVDGMTLQYKGKLLTPLHFKMSPKSPPSTRQRGYTRIPGQAIKAAGNPAVVMVQPLKPYKVRATIIKGKRATLPVGPNSDGMGTFLAAGNGGVTLPFQRTGSGRKMEAVRTLSVPQMIDGRARETVLERINEGMEKRLENHLKQAMK